MKAKISNRLLSSLNPSERPYEVRDTQTKGFILRVQPSGVMSYICEYKRGKRITIAKVGKITPIEARDRAMTILADATKGVDPIEKKRLEREKSDVQTLADFIESTYAPWLSAHHSDGKASLLRLRTHFVEAFGDTSLADLTSWQIEKWRSRRLKEGTSPATVNRDINLLKAALRRAVEWGFIEVNPLGTIKPVKTDGRAIVRFLSEQEELCLRIALDQREVRLVGDQRNRELGGHLRPMILLAINTGLRRGEIFNLRWKDLDIDRALLTVHGIGAKSSQTRHVPLNNEALTHLKVWGVGKGSPESFVFPNKNGGRLANVNTAFKKVLSNAGIIDFRWHDLRHTFASKLIMAGVDLNTVRELLGHADIKMTLRYAHLAPHVKAAAVAKLAGGDSASRTKA